MARAQTADVSFRELTIHDFEVLKRLGVQCLPLPYDDSFWLAIAANKLNTGAYNRENNLVGAIGIVRSAKDEFNVKDLHPEEQKLVNNFRKTCYISTLIVAPDFRKKGIATQLLQRGTTRLAQKGSQLVYLHVLHSNIPAIRLYEKLGFERVADVPNYYTINGARETGIIYSKGLTSGTCQQCGTQDCRCTIT